VLLEFAVADSSYHRCPLSPSISRTYQTEEAGRRTVREVGDVGQAIGSALVMHDGDTERRNGRGQRQSGEDRFEKS